MTANFCDIVLVSKMGWYVAVHHPEKRSLRTSMYFDRPDLLTLLADLPPAEEFISEELRREGADFVSRRRVTVHALTSPGTDLTELTGAEQTARP